MSKIIRLTETELVRLVNRIVKENNEDIEFEGFDTPLEDEPSLFDDDNDDDIDDINYIKDDYLDIENKYNNYDDEFQREMNLDSHTRNNRQSDFGIGAGTRWDKDSEKEWSPIKPSDMPLEKYLKTRVK
jgi:hypothetical protein